MNRIIIALLIGLLAPTVFAASATDVPLDSKRLPSVLRDLIGQPSLIREALGKLKDRVDADLPSSMINEKDLEQIEKQTTLLNRLIPDPLPAMDTPKGIQSLAAKGPTAGTLIGSQDELRRLRAAADKRADDIKNLGLQRDEAGELAERYKGDANLAGKLADEIGEKALTVEVEVAGRLAGKSVALSWADLETELVPALQKRQEAAEGVVSRYSSVIKAAEKDLTGFKDALTFGTWIFSGDTSSRGAATIDPRTLPGVSADDIARSQREMDENTKASLELANQMRAEAADIRKHNAEISNYQEMLGMISSGISAAEQIKASGSPNKQSPQVQINYSKTENKWQTTIVNEPSQPVPINPKQKQIKQHGT
jgi:hypothetical protein